MFVSVGRLILTYHYSIKNSNKLYITYFLRKKTKRNQLINNMLLIIFVDIKNKYITYIVRNEIFCIFVTGSYEKSVIYWK